MSYCIQKLINQYDSVHIFSFATVGFFTVILFFIRTFVPSSINAHYVEDSAAMEKVCQVDRLQNSNVQIQKWLKRTDEIVSRLNCAPVEWQNSIKSLHAFVVDEESDEVIHDGTSLRSSFIDTANYAAELIELRSIMSGSTMLANINGDIYREGEKILIRGGEIVMQILELGPTYATVCLFENDFNGDTKRTIYLTSGSPFAKDLSSR
tara:strand:- start:589 stop:1212 length:624 start_codon:yes stop_codon:yes gene_type:complete